MSIENRTIENAVRFPRVKVLPVLGLLSIIALGTFLRFYHLGATGVGNEYYAAAVKSMLTSWHNFFFVAFEPGGSISVDKPPLGLWSEAISALFLGLNGFALAFPNALAGVLSIPLLYSMVRQPFGRLAGLIAALVLATMPITIAAERNNTSDGLLVFVLLLSAWAVWKSVASGKFRYLLLGALIVGLGFNIKMLQAYLILPALYALYFFGAKHRWPKRLGHLGLATIVLLAVSLSWAIVVDAMPADSRPFIGSSTDNTVMELIIGHNGLRRLLGQASYTQVTAYLQASSQASQTSATGNPTEVGPAGVLRLFTEPLVTQASWLLPLALLGLGFTLVVLGKPYPFTDKHLALILWAGWLLPMGLYFTFTSGLWHTYYLVMLGPALAALIGTTVWASEQLLERRRSLGWSLIAVLSGITIGFEIAVLSAYPAYCAAVSIPLGLLWLIGLTFLWVHPQRMALGLILLSLLIGPLLWSGLTTFNPEPEVDLPVAGPTPGRPGNSPVGMVLSSAQEKVLDYLLAHTASDPYLAATLDSYGAAPLILRTGRPVLTFGGYIGKDEAITVDRLQAMTASGQLRYVVDNGNLAQKAEIAVWVGANCAVVQVPGVTPTAAVQQGAGGPRDQQFTTLYDCASAATATATLP